MENKERPPEFPKKKRKFPEYAPDFGSVQAEEMFEEFLKIEVLPFADKVEKASEYDDKITKVDRWVYIKGKPVLGIQQKFSESEERIKEAIKIILKQPLVQVHDDEGKILFDKKVPRVIVHDNLKEWGEAYNQYIKEELLSPLEKLGNKPRRKIMILKQMIDCLKTEKYYFPQHSEVFDEILALLEKEMEKSK